MSSKDRWAGIGMLKEDYEAKVYARKDRHQQFVPLDERARATAEYLADF